MAFPIDPNDLKLTGCTHGDVVNIYTKFEAIWTKKILCEIQSFSQFVTF